VCAVWNFYNRVHPEKRDEVVLWILAQLLRLHDFLTSHDQLLRTLRLLFISKILPINSNRSLSVNHLSVDYRNICLDCGQEDDFIPRERAVYDGKLFRGNLRITSRLLVEALFFYYVGAEHSSRRNEWYPHRSGREPLHHPEVAVVFPLDGAFFDRAPEAGADAGEGLIGFVREFNSLDATGANQHVEVTAGGVSVEMKISLLLPDEFVDEGHRVALGSKATERDMSAAWH